MLKTRKATRAKWDEYQHFMTFLKEWLPSIKTRRRGRIVILEQVDLKYKDSDESRPVHFPLDGDYYESLVRRYLRLPTVQQSRRDLDAEVKRIQAKANS